MTTLRNENRNTQPDARDQELIALGLKFALAIMDEHHHTALIPPDADLDTEIALMAAACAPTQAMFEEIERRTATTLEGHLVKALARRWDDGYLITRAAA